jgi:predicted DCC family thiol-disulfide oxidoreductase YuxK
MTGATLVYDDDCGFCTWWARLVERRSDVPLVGFSELEAHPDLRARLPEDYEECSHLVTDEDVYSCGASIEEAIVRARVCGLDLAGSVGFLRHFRDYNRLREGTYRWVAEHRGLLGKVFRATPPARARREEEDGGTEADDDED